MNTLPSISLNTDAKSPFYFASFYGADGKQKRRSTKVPAGGGIYQGRRITAAQAKSIAMRVAAEIANAEHQEYHAADNRTPTPPSCNTRPSRRTALRNRHQAAEDMPDLEKGGRVQFLLAEMGGAW